MPKLIKRNPVPDESIVGTVPAGAVESDACGRLYVRAEVKFQVVLPDGARLEGSRLVAVRIRRQKRAGAVSLASD